MKLLLDTHIWIWSLFEPDRLCNVVRMAVESPDNELWISPISTWETLLLMERGRIEVDEQPQTLVPWMLKAGPFREAPVTHAVSLESRRIALPHADPADRFLAATAVVYDLTLVTADARLQDSDEYAVMTNG